MGEAIIIPLREPYREVISALEELRDDVENINNRFTGEFRGRVLSHDEVLSTTVLGMTYGYKLRDLGKGDMEREIMVRLGDGGKIKNLTEDEREPYILPIFEVFFKEGYTDILPMEIQDCLIFRQKFQIAYLHEFKPGLVVPGKVH